MVRTEGESCKINEAKRVAVGISHNGREYGVVMRTKKVGYRLQLFYPIMEMGVQDETKMVDIEPGDEMIVVDARSLDRALATFGTQDVHIVLDERRLRLTNDLGSYVELESAASRQLELPLAGMAQKPVASSVAAGIDADALGSEAMQVSAMALCNALLPARGVTTMGGNRGDMRGVHVHASRSETEACLRVVGAHEKGIFIYEDEQSSFKADETPVSCIISPDSAKRLRELLLAEVAGDQDEKGVSHKRVWLKQLGEEYLVVCCGQWLMRIDLEDICQQDCEELLGKRGTHVYELKRTALLQAVGGLLLMGETEAFVTLADDCIWLEGESQAQRGKLRVDCQHYGMETAIPVRKYALKPMAVMLSAACVAENNKNVKLLADPDDEVLGIECEEYMVFVR